MRAWPSQFLRSLNSDEAQPLQVRLYRLVCVTAAVLCLAIIFPANLLQNLPLGVHLANLTLGLTAAWCYRASTKGRHHFIGFFVIMLLLVNPAWFLNAGADGSVSYYFYPILVYPLAIFRGKLRWAVAALVALDFCALLLASYYFPVLRTPFHEPGDRLIDLIVGGVCSMLGLGALIWLIVSAHEREQHRISRYAEEVAAGEEKYREIFDSTSEALFIYEEDGRLIDVNKSMCLMYGCNRAAAFGESMETRSLGTSPYSGKEAMVKMKQAFDEGPQAFQWRSRRTNGELFWSEVEMHAADIAGRRRLIIAVRDIDLRVQAEEALRTQEERLRLAMEASDQGWFDLNIVTGEGSASGEYARIIGLEPREFKVTATGWLEAIHPEDVALVKKEFQACVVQGDTRTMEYRRRMTNGDWKWIRSTGRIVERDSTGRAVRMTGTHADITERKKLEAQLLHSQRMESVGTLAGGVAHDLNNILTPMLMAGTVLKEKLTDPVDRALMMQMEAGAKRGAAIVRQLLAFSRDLPQTRVAVDVVRQIEEMMEVMRGTFPREIKLVARLPAGLWPVTADPIQLHQVIMNLCINARDAMPNGGTLTLTAENIIPGSGGLKDRSVRITVSDTGHGIPPENLGRIFDPFFTTKGVGKGTGLGLSTVHGIMKSHGGSIMVTSELNRGASFHATLPASATAPLPPAVAVEITPKEPRKPVILVVDDEELVLSVTTRILERNGYEVVPASGGKDALKRMTELSGSVDLVITDMMMPDMDGQTLVPKLREGRPNLKIIGVSGLDFDLRKEKMRAIGFSEMLRKPYDMATLMAAVRQQLSAANQPG
jgi:two-component system, cell cycle sensor histidine kinase and response regulator CckA